MPLAEAIATGDADLVVPALCAALDRSPGPWWWAWFGEVYRPRVRPVLQKSGLVVAARLIELLDGLL